MDEINKEQIVKAAFNTIRQQAGLQILAKAKQLAVSADDSGYLEHSDLEELNDLLRMSDLEAIIKELTA